MIDQRVLILFSVCSTACTTRVFSGISQNRSNTAVTTTKFNEYYSESSSYNKQNATNIGEG